MSITFISSFLLLLCLFSAILNFVLAWRLLYAAKWAYVITLGLNALCLVTPLAHPPATADLGTFLAALVFLGLTVLLASVYRQFFPGETNASERADATE